MSDKMREDFEAWAKEKYMLDKSKYGGYMAVSTENAFDAWQAAIDSVVVDVESLPSASYTDDGVVYRSHVEDALEKAGIKCK